MATNMVTVLEHYHVSPPLDPSITAKLLPLTFLDLIWLNMPFTRRVYFYDLPCSTTDEFMQTLFPHLKESLALTFKYYFPLCGNLLTPTNLASGTTPAIRCLNNDSVTLTVAEFTGAISQGFEYLSGNHARDVDELLALVPAGLSRGDTDTVEDGSIMISPVLSTQVTLFPNQGFSIGFNISHAVADGKAMSDFIRTWASINVKQLSRKCEFEYIESLPFCDRSVIQDPKGITSIYLRAQHDISKYNKDMVPPKKDQVRATLVMNLAQIQGLKNLVLAQIPHVSTFIVTCAYVWTCMVKARATLQKEKNDENEDAEHFAFPIDVRTRLDPPISSNYLGNALALCRSSLKTCQLVGDEGFRISAEEISKNLDEKLNHEEGVLQGMEKLYESMAAIKGQRFFSASGSPKFDYYGTDFGWGKPRKYENLSGDFALHGFRELKGDFEIGICLTRDEMDAFTSIFHQGLIH